MAKLATVRLGWTRSPSADAEKVEITVNINGAETKAELPIEVEEYLIEVAALGAVQFSVKTFDSEGNESTSEVHDFVLGDLEAPAPASNLFHEVVAIRDEEDS